MTSSDEEAVKRGERERLVRLMRQEPSFVLLSIHDALDLERLVMEGERPTDVSEVYSALRFYADPDSWARGYVEGEGSRPFSHASSDYGRRARAALAMAEKEEYQP